MLKSDLMDSQDTKLALAMAAWRSHQRHQREADHWLKMYEQRVTDLCYGDREKIRRQTEARQPEFYPAGS